MARFTRLQVLQNIGDSGLMPLFYSANVEDCKKVIHAIHQGGARILEFTNRGDFAHEVFGEINKYCAKNLPDLILGIGSVGDAATAALYMQLGANFIVSASLREDVAVVCNRRKVPYMPGCGTLTEIGKAEELGCEIVKLFPGNVYGPKFIKSIKGPQPWTSIMPTGGVSPKYENLQSWIDAGAICVGMGSQLIAKDADGTYDLARIEKLTRESLETIRQIRQG